MPDDSLDTLDDDAPTDRDTAFPVVGVGCSAGGLTALQSLLEGLGPEPAVSIVVLHHTDPGQAETLVPILQRATDLPVEMVEEGGAPTIDTVMVVPPGNAIQLREGRFQLEPADRTVQHDVVDRFFASLAKGLGRRAVGVVLSGSLTDGSMGLRDIQRAGGLTLAQDEASASHPSMPGHAIDDGHVDIVLSPEEIGARLARLSKQGQGQDPGTTPQQAEDPETLRGIFQIVNDATGVDFSTYKSTTLARRIDRRRMATGSDTLEAYLEVLEDDPEEAKTLHDESLIHVTGFFRDPESFDALREEAFDHLEQIAREDPPVRIWVPGCATGEEAYSLAIALDEHLDEKGIAPRIQLFGTDLSEEAIETARQGIYPRRIEDGLSEKRLDRYFLDQGETYRVRESLRNHCIFARHDLIEDSPFSKIDLISCRNLLIYLDRDRQQRATATLHYALSEDGILLLGSSESPESDEDLFTPLDAQNRIFRKRSVSTSPYLHRYQTDASSSLDPTRRTSDGASTGSSTLEDDTDRLLLDRFAPPGIVVDEDLRVLQFRGDIGALLQPAEGQASLKLTRIAPQRLALTVRSLVQACKEDGESKRRDEVQVETDDGARTLTIQVLPLGGSVDEPPEAYLAVFQEKPEQGSSGRASWGQGAADFLQGLLGGEEPAESERTQQLEEELERTRQYLESVIAEYESMNEELRSANEEALSTTEELQSTNEELATAKEEVQSANEELNTLNEELKERNSALQELNDDLTNLLRSVELPILILDDEMRIRRFTSAAEELFDLREGDEGRRLTDLQHPFEAENVQSTARKVLDSLQMATRDIEDEDGHSYQLRVRPYRTRDDEITGAILVLWGPRAPAKP